MTDPALTRAETMAMEPATRNRFSNSIPTVARLSGQKDSTPAPPIASFCGMRIVIDPNIPPNEIHVRNARGEFLYKTLLDG